MESFVECVRTVVNRRGQALHVVLEYDIEPQVVALLVPGFTRGARSATVTRLSAIFVNRGIATVRIDLAGCGHSEGDLRDFTISRAADDLADVCAWVHKEMRSDVIELVSVGVSSGGLVALAAQLNGALFNRIALLAPVLDYPRKRDREMGPAGIARWKEVGHAPWVDADGLTHEVGFGFYVDAERWRVVGRGSELTAPVLIIHGDADTNTPVEDSIRFARDARLVALRIVRGGAHRLLESSASEVEPLLARWITNA